MLSVEVVFQADSLVQAPTKKAHNGRTTSSRIPRCGYTSVSFVFFSDIVIQVAVVLADKAITLRIEEDSQQAQQLSVFCPFESSPVLILSQYDSHSIYCDRNP